MMVRNFLRICHIAGTLLLATTVLTMPVLAAERGSSAEIDKFMTGYARDLEQQLGAGARVEYSTPSLNANAEARTCTTPLAISSRDPSQSMNRLTLLVACGSEWSMYVPVDLDVYRPVVVTTKPLANGTVITADDVELNAVNISQLSGTYLTALDDAIGMGVKRQIASGRPVISQQLEAPLLVRRGDAVVISAEVNGLAVKMTGTALSDGRRGEQIRVKNQTTARVVDARVVAPGQVAVPM